MLGDRCREGHLQAAGASSQRAVVKQMMLQQSARLMVYSCLLLPCLVITQVRPRTPPCWRFSTHTAMVLISEFDSTVADVYSWVFNPKKRRQPLSSQHHCIGVAAAILCRRTHPHLQAYKDGSSTLHACAVTPTETCGPAALSDMRTWPAAQHPHATTGSQPRGAVRSAF